MVASFLPQSEKCGTERVNFDRFIYIRYAVPL